MHGDVNMSLKVDLWKWCLPASCFLLRSLQSAQLTLQQLYCLELLSCVGTVRSSDPEESNLPCSVVMSPTCLSLQHLRTSVYLCVTLLLRHQSTLSNQWFCWFSSFSSVLSSDGYPKIAEEKLCIKASDLLKRMWATSPTTSSSFPAIRMIYRVEMKNVWCLSCRFTEHDASQFLFSILQDEAASV